MAPSSSSSLSSENASTIKASDERTPLLTAPLAVPTAEPVEASLPSNGTNGTRPQDDDTPLPLAQIVLLCYARIIEPIAFFCIFPYIPQMIQGVGVDTEDVGFYAGLIESLFSVTQMCVMIFWGKAADRFGRKPVLVFSLCGVTIATALFGMSRTIWQMILFRCLAGVFAGTILTVRAMLSENSTKKTQARAFSYFAVAGNIGIFAGPLIGGALESPATKFPSLFGHVAFFKQYPYSLPGFVCAAVGGSSALLAALFVKETLHMHRNQGVNEQPMSTWELLKFPGVAKVLLINSYIMTLAFGYTAVVTVFLFTPVDLGGIGFSPALIAAVVGLNGMSQALWLLLAFPPLQHRIGTGGVFRLCAAGWPLFFAIHPLCNLFLRHHLQTLFWILGPVNCVVGSSVAMAFTGGQLAINDIAPSHETLGTLNAIALAIASGVRAVLPALSTSVYAAGVKFQIFGGELFWVLAIFMTVVLNFIVRLLPKQADGRLRSNDEEDA